MGYQAIKLGWNGLESSIGTKIDPEQSLLIPMQSNGDARQLPRAHVCPWETRFTINSAAGVLASLGAVSEIDVCPRPPEYTPVGEDTQIPKPP